MTNFTDDNTSLAVRRLREDDVFAVRLLAARDTAPVPYGDLLGAVTDRGLVAAISLADGSVIADPFQPTAAAVEMLELRAQQLRDEQPKRGRKFRVPSLPRARGALAGSVPGSSKLLQL